MNSKILENLGLSKTESQIYLAALELGESLHKQLAEKAGIKRPTLYEVIPKLFEKGLISKSIKGKRQFLVPEDPQKFLEAKKLELEALQNQIPLLQSLMLTAKSRPKISLYEGIEGIKKVYQDHIEQGEPILEIVGIEKIQPEISKYIKKDYIWARVRKKIPLKMLISGPKTAGIFKMKSDTHELREVKNVEEKFFSMPLGINIYGNNVSFAVYREDSEPVGVIIRSKEISAGLQSIFNFIWNRL
ncbi:MAG: hypothetical protein JNN11_00400 [Candidatus Doudnabacteria bacterium]|nr:hypothetical protein [Candidatus Doudnabacteria bacterium]